MDFVGMTPLGETRSPGGTSRNVHSCKAHSHMKRKCISRGGDVGWMGFKPDFIQRRKGTRVDIGWKSG
jgi:hypothetical protein